MTFRPSGAAPEGLLFWRLRFRSRWGIQPPTTMHPTSPDTRTQFLATPQFGFAHLRDDRARTEPLHDFLVVQFGAAADVAVSRRDGPRFSPRRYFTRDLP